MSTTATILDAEQAFDVEQRLISRSKAGDKQAFEQLYKRYVGMVYSLCLKLMVDRNLAEDATQEVFIQLWRKLENFHGDSKFSTWLHSVTSNVAISYLRKQRGWLHRMFDIEQTEVMQHQAQASTAEVDLESYIKRLPERARIVFVLHAIEGYRHEEIAALTNMAVGSSKAQFHRAKQLLHEWMDDE